jgi:hypothetical protein
MYNVFSISGNSRKLSENPELNEKHAPGCVKTTRKNNKFIFFLIVLGISGNVRKCSEMLNAIVIIYSYV